MKLPHHSTFSSAPAYSCTFSHLCSMNSLIFTETGSYFTYGALRPAFVFLEFPGVTLVPKTMPVSRVQVTGTSSVHYVVRPSPRKLALSVSPFITDVFQVMRHTSFVITCNPITIGSSVDGPSLTSHDGQTQLPKCSELHGLHVTFKRSLPNDLCS